MENKLFIPGPTEVREEILILREEKASDIRRSAHIGLELFTSTEPVTTIIDILKRMLAIHLADVDGLTEQTEVRDVA